MDLTDVYEPSRFHMRDAAIGLYCLWWGVGATEATEIRLNPPYVLAWLPVSTRKSRFEAILSIYDLVFGEA